MHTPDFLIPRVSLQGPPDRDHQPLWAETPWTETPIPPEGTWHQGQRPPRRHIGAG